jgi:death-on-curing protein
LPKKYKKITLEQLKILHFNILKNEGQDYLPLPPSKEKDLIAILNNIDQHVYGKELYPTLCDKAMYILMRIEQSQAFPDGNKRVALAACELFLNINGSSFNSIISQKMKVRFMLALATNKIAKEKAVKCCIEAIRN